MKMEEMAAVLDLAKEKYLDSGKKTKNLLEKEICDLMAATIRIGCLLIVDRMENGTGKTNILEQYDKAIEEISQKAG